MRRLILPWCRSCALGARRCLDGRNKRDIRRDCQRCVSGHVCTVGRQNVAWYEADTRRNDVVDWGVFGVHIVRDVIVVAD